MGEGLAWRTWVGIEEHPQPQSRGRARLAAKDSSGPEQQGPPRLWVRSDPGVQLPLVWPVGSAMAPPLEGQYQSLGLHHASGPGNCMVVKPGYKSQLRSQGELGSPGPERLGLSRELCLIHSLTHNRPLQLTQVHRVSQLRNPAELTVQWGKWGDDLEGALERKTWACLHS